MTNEIPPLPDALLPDDPQIHGATAEEVDDAISTIFAEAGFTECPISQHDKNLLVKCYLKGPIEVCRILFPFHI